ncbi:hypothetical protein [Pararhodospirillum photometricum]|uniref:hypothetical protein n=1 Tax=Pararhodospirillum photometricum TaxID=1084 RepID=UPI0003124DF8|nr:hypothetical protein [Pararhodospirillum photometricum]
MTSAREDGFRLCLDGAGVVLTPRPVVRLGPVVAGRPVAEVEALLPRLFALCGQAHREAFRRALTPPRPEAVLPGVVVAEGLGELAVRLLVEGAALLPAPPDIPGARQLRALVQEVLAGHTPDRATLDAAALPLLGDLSPEAFAALTEAEALAAWAQRNTVLPARLLAAALTRPALCRPAPPAAPALDDIDRTALAQRLRTDPDFPRTPAWPSPRETSALTRHAGHPLDPSLPPRLERRHRHPAGRPPARRGPALARPSAPPAPLPFACRSERCRPGRGRRAARPPDVRSGSPPWPYPQPAPADPHRLDLSPPGHLGPGPDRARRRGGPSSVVAGGPRPLRFLFPLLRCRGKPACMSWPWPKA